MNSSSGITSSGGHANHTGNRLELFVVHTLEQEGYQNFWNHKEQMFANRHVIGGKQYARQVVIMPTIYDTKRKCDFFIINKDKFPDGLIIECKWQASRGSVDEKYPFLLFNIFKCAIPTIILIDGGGYKPAAMKWLKDQVDPNRALIGVWNMSDFQMKTNNGFLR